MLVPKTSIKQMKNYPFPAEERLRSVRLDFNENVIGASPKVMEALRSISKETCGCYPDYGNLYQTLSRDLEIDQNCLLVSNGSDEAIKMIFETYVDRRDEVILLSPSYYMYEFFAQAAGAKITWVAYGEGFTFPLEEILGAIKPETRLIAIANPNNPTGTFIERKDLLRIIQANANMAILIDEAYWHFAKKTNFDLSLQYPNVFVTRTFSKAYGLAGLRIGYVISMAENIAMLAKLLLPCYSVNCFAAAAAIAALKDTKAFEDYIDDILATRLLFTERLAGMGFPSVPSETNFVLVKFGEWKERVLLALTEDGILVRDRRDVQGYLRITIGTREQMQRVIDTIDSLLRKPALIFDMDGVLVDESLSYRLCILKTAEHFFGSDIDPACIERLKDKGGYNNDYDCTAALLTELGKTIHQKAIVERFDAYYESLKHAEKWLINEKLLSKLKQKFRLAIFTGRPRRDAWDALKRFGKETLFDVIITDDDVKLRKPDPEGLLLAMRQLKAVSAIYFGDSKDDAEAARQASVPFVEILSPGCGLELILERILCEEDG